MASQPSHRPDQASEFFADGQVQRPLVAGTVARGHLRTDRHLFEARGPADPWLQLGPKGAVGVFGGNVFAALAALAAAEGTPTDTFPFDVTYDVLVHGRNRYMIYCVVCHDALGTGQGIIVQRGYTAPPPFHIERLRQVAVGHIYEVIAQGYGSMPSYAEQIPPRDRWAIAAYVRALQTSQHFPESKLTDEMRRQWKESGSASSGGAP